MQTKDIQKHCTIRHNLQPRCTETQRNPNEKLVLTTQTLRESFRMPPLSVTRRTNHSKTFWSELRSLPNLKKKKTSKLWFIATQTFSFSCFLERQSRLSYKKVFSSLELYLFRLKKKRGVICGKEDDNITTIFPTRYTNPLCIINTLIRFS